LADLSVAGLRARHRHLAAKIAGIGFTATGTVLRSHNVCGTPGCSCHTDPGKRHGPYWQYTRKINGKTVTRRLTSAQATQYARWIDNGRALRDLLAQMQQVSDQARDLILATPPEDRQTGR
jgi:alcohol dehydrogenase class IV